MTLSNAKIRTTKPSDKRQLIPIDGNGLYLIVEKHPLNSKTFEGRMKFPRTRQGKTKYVPIGIWEKDIQDKEDAIKKWDLIKSWSKQNDLCPTLFEKQTQKPHTQKSLKEVFDAFTEYQKKTVKEVTWKDRRNKLDQMLEYFGKETPLVNFELDNGGRELVIEMQGVIESRGSHDHAGRCRSLLKGVFNFAIDRGWMRENQNPASRKPKTEGIGHTPKSNPTISWNEVPELMTSINENHCDGSILTQLALKFYLMSCCRVGAVVRLEWDWFDASNDMWVIPASTTGLKRKMKTYSDDYAHIIPATPEMHLVMDELRKISGYQKYVFLSPEGKKYQHLNPETINTYLSRLGWKKRLTAHGWRDVLVTAGQEVGEFPKEIIFRQIGHTEHKQGTSGAYDNTQFIDFIDKRRELMNWWTKELVDQGLRI